jgi:hypothetical protein
VVASGAINIATGLARKGGSGVLSLTTGDSAVHDAGSIAVEGASTPERISQFDTVIYSPHYLQVARARRDVVGLFSSPAVTASKEAQFFSLRGKTGQPPLWATLQVRINL